MTLRAEVEALKAAKLRLMALWDAFDLVTRRKASYQRSYAQRLEAGDTGTCATWSETQMSERPKHRVRGGCGHGRYKAT